MIDLGTESDEPVDDEPTADDRQQRAVTISPLQRPHDAVSAPSLTNNVPTIDVRMQMPNAAEREHHLVAHRTGGRKLRAAASSHRVTS